MNDEETRTGTHEGPRGLLHRLGNQGRQFLWALHDAEPGGVSAIAMMRKLDWPPSLVERCAQRLIKWGFVRECSLADLSEELANFTNDKVYFLHVDPADLVALPKPQDYSAVEAQYALSPEDPQKSAMGRFLDLYEKAIQSAFEGTRHPDQDAAFCAEQALHTLLTGQLKNESLQRSFENLGKVPYEGAGYKWTGADLQKELRQSSVCEVPGLDMGLWYLMRSCSVFWKVLKSEASGPRRVAWQFGGPHSRLWLERDYDTDAEFPVGFTIGCREWDPVTCTYGWGPARAKWEDIRELAHHVISIGAGARKGPHARNEVLKFARLMEEQLRANDHKPGWLGDTLDMLFQRLEEEVEELKEVLYGFSRSDNPATWLERLEKESADVGNFCMMIVDLAQAHAAPTARQRALQKAKEGKS